MADSLIIEGPAIPPETPPEKDEVSNGFALIKAIYDFIVPRDLIAYSLVKKYKELLGANNVLGNIMFTSLVVLP